MYLVYYIEVDFNAMIRPIVIATTEEKAKGFVREAVREEFLLAKEHWSADQCENFHRMMESDSGRLIKEATCKALRLQNPSWSDDGFGKFQSLMESDPMEAGSLLSKFQGFGEVEGVRYMLLPVDELTQRG